MRRFSPWAACTKLCPHLLLLGLVLSASSDDIASGSTSLSSNSLTPTSLRPTLPVQVCVKGCTSISGLDRCVRALQTPVKLLTYTCYNWNVTLPNGTYPALMWLQDTSSQEWALAGFLTASCALASYASSSSLCAAETCCVSSWKINTTTLSGWLVDPESKFPPTDTPSRLGVTIALAVVGFIVVALGFGGFAFYFFYLRRRSDYTAI